MSNSPSYLWRILKVLALLLALVASVTSSVAIAQDNLTRPAYFRVTGVAANDVLNARADSSSSSAIIGSLAYDASPVEVFNQQHNWAQVSLGEQMGWVSMHFLEEISLPLIGQTALPEGLICGGTEPFWGLQVAGGQVNYSSIDQSDTSFAIYETGQFHNLGGSISFVLAQGSGKQFTGIVSNQMCSDGMSDRDYPRRIDLLLSTPDGTVGQSGCCHIAISQ